VFSVTGWGLKPTNRSVRPILMADAVLHAVSPFAVVSLAVRERVLTAPVELVVLELASVLVPPCSHRRSRCEHSPFGKVPRKAIRFCAPTLEEYAVVAVRYVAGGNFVFPLVFASLSAHLLCPRLRVLFRPLSLTMRRHARTELASALFGVEGSRI
jgi:hypothetical protein